MAKNTINYYLKQIYLLNIYKNKLYFYKFYDNLQLILILTFI